MAGRALVTGASGFVGGILLRFLRERGWETVGTGDRPDAGLIPCDFSQREQVLELMRAAGPVTHVFHLAAITFVPEAARQPVSVMQVNTLGVMYLVEAMKQHAPDARLIFVGSAEAYGIPQTVPVDEEHPLFPRNPYAISKAAADHYCAFVSQTAQLDVVRMRPFNHSGPGQSDQFVLSSFARQIAEIEAGLHEPVLEVGNLDSERDFLHVQDVLSAYELAALKGRTGEAYNICSGAAHRIDDALNTLLRLARCEISVHPDPERMRASEIPRMLGCNQKLRRHTGWIPEISFDTLLEDLLVSWRARAAGASGQAE